MTLVGRAFRPAAAFPGGAPRGSAAAIREAIEALDSIELVLMVLVVIGLAWLGQRILELFS